MSKFLFLPGDFDPFLSFYLDLDLDLDFDFDLFLLFPFCPFLIESFKSSAPEVSIGY